MPETGRKAVPPWNLPHIVPLASFNNNGDDVYKSEFDDLHPLAAQFREHVLAEDFPCVGAKAALSRQQMHILVAHDIASAWDDLRILPALMEVVSRYREDNTLFRTFVVIFDGPAPKSEHAFETALWARIQSLTDKDDWLGYRPDPSVDEDPESPHFSLSFGGEAFFVVGLHPLASRPARRFARPAMVFNLHDQFEELRQAGRYEKLRKSIIGRDIELAGDANPMLARHGETSEARQYSGRVVGQDWSCPYKRRAAA